MDASLRKSCLDEINHTVLDAQQKISVRTISNNYGLKFLDAVNILQQWIDKNGTKAQLVKEYIVRGFDSNRGGAFITVVNEKKLKALQSKVSQMSSVLYAVEVPAESPRKLVIPEEQEFRVINLPLQSDHRSVKVFTPTANPTSVAATSVKQELKPKINSMFSASSSKPKQEPPKPATVKDEKQSPPAATDKKETAKVASPSKSPSKVSPNKKKDAKKVVSGKASIASFFSNKPGASKPVSVNSTTSSAITEVKKEKESPKEVKEDTKNKRMPNGKREDTPRWKRMISDESDGDDVIPNTPQAKKEPVKKGGRKTQALKKRETDKGNPSKRSRILLVEDSSEEEEEEHEAQNLREPEERLIKFDVDEPEDTNMKDSDDEEENKKNNKEHSPTKPVESDASGLNRKRAKVKKLVTKNFMDDEGYMTTIKEYVMVSASEDEDGDASNNNMAEEKKKKAEKESVTNGDVDKGSKSDTKPETKKPTKVTPPTPKTKQGSIMSFFSKK